MVREGRVCHSPMSSMAAGHPCPSEQDQPQHQVRMATALCNQVWKPQARIETAHGSGNPSQGCIFSGEGVF